MEFVVVRNDETADLWIDGHKYGTTNATLAVSPGLHSFSLKDPKLPRALCRQYEIKGTTIIRPMEVRLE